MTTIDQIKNGLLDDEEECKSFVFDLTWKAIDGSVKQEVFVSSLAEKKEKWKNLDSIMADIISIIDVELSSLGTNGNAILSNVNELSSSIGKKEKFYSLISSIRPIVGDDLLKERLEIETLESLKLIPKKEVFNQKYIKIKTRLFYKQQKFNLLREEAEGYSRLITELNQTEISGKILEIIQSLIGCFNLDPNRVLDIILESFENNPLMYKTFIGLLKHYKAEDETICQIIGFKFQSLHQQQQSQAKSRKADSDVTLQELISEHISIESLYTVTSYLLKYKMIDLDLLMMHLYPNEQLIQQLYKEEFEAARQYAKKLTVINLSSDNPVSSSSSSSSSNNPPNQMDIQQAEDRINIQNLIQQSIQLNKLDNQKVYLIKSLIEIGDYNNALRLIEKLPHWYLAIYPDVTIAICKAIDTNYVDPMYKKYNSLSKYLSDKYNDKKVKTQSSQNHSIKTNGLHDMSIDENVNEIEKEEENGEENDMLAKFVDIVLPILSALGPAVSNNTILFTKLVRICVSFLNLKKISTNPLVSSSSNGTNGESDSPSKGTLNGHDQNEREMTDSNEALSTSQLGEYSQLNILKALNEREKNFYNQIYAILNEIILPSLSMIYMNPCLAIEVWNLLKHFPYEMRYHLYNNWRLNSYKHFPQLIRTKADCQEKIKYLLKRLTKENVKIHGRQIGKLSHNNPIIVCDYILTQIQRYDNFILPVVDSLKFMTPLSYDVLSYCIIVAISDADKDKMKHDSTNISSWLQSIATFCALVFKKYPIELIAMIQYVINQLKNRKSYDLLILQEIVQKMCGIEVLSEVNDLQLEAMAGGDILRQEAGYFNPIRNIKKCATRLKEALADHGLILPLCILLSQQRDYIVYSDQAEREKEMAIFNPAEKRHLKLTGSLYDQCQDSLVQFSQFLSSTLTTEEYIHIFPMIDELVNEYHVSSDVAFFLSRPMYAHHIQSKYEELRRMDRSVKTTEKPSKTQRYLESIDVVMQPVIEVARSLHPSKIWEDMSPLFYTTFWTLSMNDCYVPTTAYEKQKISLKQKLNALDDNQELTSTKKKKEKEKILIMLEKLSEEEKSQRDHVQHVKARFEKEKDHWFPLKSKTKNETITVFLQFCIFSRCLFTQIDAYYCAKFIQIIHSLKTPNFSTIICYDRIFSDISYSVASLTENEARRYGRFLLGLLETVMNWHADSSTFDNECAQFPGFLTVFRNALNSSPSATLNKQEQLDYENFRHVCHKWHYKLTKSFIVCLESKEYLQMRNSLIILTKIAPHYPKLTGFSSALEKRVEVIKQAEKDKRQDIYTLASAYLGQLKIRKSQMVDEAKFHLKDTTNADTSRSESSKNTTSLKQSTANVSSGKVTSSQNPSDVKFKQPSGSAKSHQASHTPTNISTNVTSSVQQGSSSQTNGVKSQSNGLSNSSSVSNVSSNIQQASQSKSIDLNQNHSTSKTISSNSNTISNSSSKTGSSSSKESSSDASRPSKDTLTNSTSSPATIVISSSNNTVSSTSSRLVLANTSPPGSKTSSSDVNKDDNVKANGSNSSTSKNGASSSSSKRPALSSIRSSPSSVSKESLTTNQLNNGANSANYDYSPTSSVSSDEMPSSPKRPNVENGASQKSSHHHNHHHQKTNSHSRSTSPSNKTSYSNENNSNYVSSSISTGSSNNHRSSSTSSEKTKRGKTSEDSVTTNANGNGTSTKTSHSSNNSNGTHDQTVNSGSSASSSSSSRLKLSRERDRGSERDRERDRTERDSKEKKEHRKREHSSEVGSDVQHKRSKSDEAKKKSTSTSTLSSSSSSAQSAPISSSSSAMPPSSSSQSLSTSINLVSTQSSSQSSTSSSDSRSKRSSKPKNEKDEYQTVSNSNSVALSQGSSNQQSISGGGVSATTTSGTASSKSHRSSGDDRRFSHDKNSYYSKEKK